MLKIGFNHVLKIRAKVLNIGFNQVFKIEGNLRVSKQEYDFIIKGTMPSPVSCYFPNTTETKLLQFDYFWISTYPSEQYWTEL